MADTTRFKIKSLTPRVVGGEGEVEGVILPRDYSSSYDKFRNNRLGTLRSTTR